MSELLSLTQTVLPTLVLLTGLSMAAAVYWWRSARRSRLEMSNHLSTETLMREREEFFSIAPDLFCIVDQNNHLIEVNRAFVEVMAYTREELLGASYMQLIHKEDREKIGEVVSSLISGNSLRDLEIKVIDKNEAEHWLELSATLSSDDLIYVAARDTTEIRRAREKLRESETLLKIAEKAAGIGGWVVEISTGEVRWSHAMFDIFEMPVGQVPDVDEGLALFLPESRTFVTKALDACMYKGNAFDIEAQILTRHGGHKWVRVIGQAIRDDSGVITQAQGGMQDITTSYEAMAQIERYAERQTTLFESITDAFFTLDHEGRFTYVNRRSEELLKLSRDHLLGKTHAEVFPNSTANEFRRHYRYAMETGTSVFFEAYYAPLDNWVEVSAYPSDEGLAVYYRRINDRVLAQQQLKQTMAELERSNSELQGFASVASHDLQEPLRKIQAFSDRLLTRSDGFDERDRDYLRRMQSAAGRMQSLIQDLLAYSRVTTQKSAMAKCDANNIFIEVLQDMETLVKDTSADIEIRPLPTIVGDASQLRQVFQNLLSNAIKFHRPDQNPEVLIYAENSGEDGWTLVVSDKGVGFEQRYAEQLFQPFKRLHGQAFPGTGVGMAIVKKILERHGASITVESKVDRGTTFRIGFPVNNRVQGIRHD